MRGSNQICELSHTFGAKLAWIKRFGPAPESQLDLGLLHPLNIYEDYQLIYSQETSAAKPLCPAAFPERSLASQALSFFQSQ